MTGVLAEADKVLGAVHDVAIAVFQKMADQLAGQACPLADDNLTVAKQINERAERFGLGLYFRYHDQFHRVTLDMKPIGERYWKGTSPEAIAAGRITPRTIKGPGEPAGHEILPTGKRLAEAAAFPLLIVARTAEQAEAIWQARQSAD